MPQPTIPDALWRLPASQTAALVRAHQVSATEVARAALARVDAVNPRLNAIVECRPDEVLARAAAIDAALARGEDPGPLAGVPITTKVNVDQAGYATTTTRVGGPLRGIQICQHHCPVSHVAAEFPELCEAEQQAIS